MEQVHAAADAAQEIRTLLEQGELIKYIISSMLILAAVEAGFIIASIVKWD